MSVVAILQKPG